MKRVLGNLIRANGVTANTAGISGVFHSSEMVDLKEKDLSVGSNSIETYLKHVGGIQDYYDIVDMPSVTILGADGTLRFKPDGTRVYGITTTGFGAIVQYDLATAWDTRTMSSPQFFFVYPETAARAITFSSDGVYMYVHGTTTDDLVQYELTTPWDITTAEEVRRIADWCTGAIYDMHLNNDGTRLFILVAIAKTATYENYPLLQYNLTDPYNIFSMTANTSGVYSSQFDETLTTDMYIKYHFTFLEDQSKIFFYSDYNQMESVREFRFSNTQSISTGTYYANTSVSIPDASYNVDKGGINFSANGEYLYLRADNQSINRYHLTTPFDPTSITANTITVENSLLFTNHTGYAGAEWSSDGTQLMLRMNGAIQNNADVVKYELDTAWDLNTAKFSGKVFNSAPWLTATGTDMRVGNSGTKLYILDEFNDGVHQWTMSTAWDPTTATYDGLFNNIADLGATAESGPRGMAFKSDGTKFYLYGTTTDKIQEFDLTTAWDLTGTVTYSAISPAIFNNLYSIDFNATGTKVAGISVSSDTAYSYDLSTAWDISTLNATATTQVMTVADNNPFTLRFMNSGNKVMISGSQFDPEVTSLDLGTAYDISTANTAAKTISDVGLGDIYGVFVSPDGNFTAYSTYTTRYVVGYTTSSNGTFDTSTVNSVERFNAYADTDQYGFRGLFFKPDGTKMYLQEYANDIKQFSLSTAWDVSTASYDSVVYDIDGAGISANQGIFFKADGTKLFTIGLNNEIRSHTLSTAWDLTTASLDTQKIELIDVNWNGIWVSTDGTKVYASAYNESYVVQFNLTTAWDLSTWDYTGGTFFAGNQNVPINVGGFSFSNDGTKLYLMHTKATDGGYSTYDANRLITVYLDTAWQINTAQWLRDVDVAFEIDRLGTTSALRDIQVPPDGDLHVLSSSTAWRPTIVITSQKKRNWYDKIDGYDLISPTNQHTLEEMVRFKKAVSFDHWTDYSYGFCYGDSGSQLYMIDSSMGSVFAFDLSVPYDPSTATIQNTSFWLDNKGWQTTEYNAHVWYDIGWNDDGTYFYVLGQSSDVLFQLTASTAWDITTLSYPATYGAYNPYLDVTNQENSPTSFTFSPDGTKLYVVGITGDDINTYVLSEPWIIGSADPAGNGGNSGFANSIPFQTPMVDPYAITTDVGFTSFYVIKALNEVMEIGPIDQTLGITHTGTGNNHVEIVNLTDSMAAGGITSEAAGAWDWGNLPYENNNWTSVNIGIYNRIVQVDTTFNKLIMAAPIFNASYAGASIYDLATSSTDPLTNLKILDNPAGTMYSTSTTYDNNVPCCMFYRNTSNVYYAGGNYGGPGSQASQWYPTTNPTILQQGAAFVNTNSSNKSATYFQTVNTATFPDEITGVTFSRDGTSIFIAMLNGLIGQWNVPTAWDISSIVTPNAYSGAYAIWDTTYGTATSDGLGDIEISDDGLTLFALNHHGTAGSMIEVFALASANDLKTIRRTGRIITGPHTGPADTNKVLANSLCFRNGLLIFGPTDVYDGTTWYDDYYVIDFNRSYSKSGTSNLPATLQNANSVSATTLVSASNTYTISLYVTDPEGSTGTWGYEKLSGNGTFGNTVGSNGNVNFADITNVGNGTFTITSTANQGHIVTQSANVSFYVDIGERLSVSTLLRGYDYPASITGSSLGANTDLEAGETYTYNFTVSDPENETGTNWQYNITDGNITVGTDPNSNFFVSANNVGNGTFIFTTTSNLEILVANSTNNYQSSNLTFTVDLTNETATLGPSTFKGSSGTKGSKFATQYVGLTSGTIVSHSTGDGTSIDTAIGNLNNGDALLLEPGTYTCGGNQEHDAYNTDIFETKYFLLAGNTDDAADVVIEYDHDQDSGVRDHPIFGSKASSETDSLARQMAFLTYKRVQTSTTNYISALVRGHVSSDPAKGKMINCYVDLNNGNASWNYDNSNLTTLDVRFHNCTFANYGTWAGKYSGSNQVVHVYNGLFDDTYNSTDAQFYGTTTGSATVDTTNRTYDVSTYTSSGHLVIDANYLDHANTS